MAVVDIGLLAVSTPLDRMQSPSRPAGEDIQAEGKAVVLLPFRIAVSPIPEVHRPG
jgi:hypothetical protein